MRRTSAVTITAALTTALALVAAPALANGGGQEVVMPPWTWYVGAGTDKWGVEETTFYDEITYASDAWDGAEMVFFGPDSVALGSAITPAAPSGSVPFVCDSTSVTVAGDDRVVNCDDTVIAPWGLSITSNARILAPGDLARTTFFVTNTTSAPIALGYEYSWDYGMTSGHVRSTQPDVVQDTFEDEGFLAFPDVWSYKVGDGTLNAGVAWGIGGQPYFGTESTHNGDDKGAVLLLPSVGRMIAAGETIALVFFHKVQQPDVLLQEPDPGPTALAAPTATDESAPASASTPTPASSHSAETPASFMAEFASFSGRLTRGLPADVTVGNWQPAATADPDPELADTGAGFDEQLLMGGIAAALLGTGAALIAIRRFTVRPARC